MNASLSSDKTSKQCSKHAWYKYFFCFGEINLLFKLNLLCYHIVEMMESIYCHRILLYLLSLLEICTMYKILYRVSYDSCIILWYVMREFTEYMYIDKGYYKKKKQKQKKTVFHIWLKKNICNNGIHSYCAYLLNKWYKTKFIYHSIRIICIKKTYCFVKCRATGNT